MNASPISTIAPKVAGRLFDQGVGYGVNFYFLASWCFLGAIVLFFMRRPEASAARDAGSGTFKGGTLG